MTSGREHSHNHNPLVLTEKRLRFIRNSDWLRQRPCLSAQPPELQKKADLASLTSPGKSRKNSWTAVKPRSTTLTCASKKANEFRGT